MRALLYVLLAACAVDPHDPADELPDGRPFQMNDVTILFPLTAPVAQRSTAYLAASERGKRGVLLPSTLYDAIGHISGSTATTGPGPIVGEAAYADLRVVAMRIDPCFAALDPDPHGVGCTNQLRLVFQQVTDVGGHLEAFDSGLHVSYRLAREELVALTRAIASLRVTHSNGERLGAVAPHPIMASQGLDGPMAEGVRSLIRQYAGQQNLTLITQLSAVWVFGKGFRWDFAGFDISDAGAPAFTSMVIPTLAGDTTRQAFFRGLVEVGMEGELSPATTDADNLVPLVNATTAAQLDPAARLAAFDALVRIDNPTRHTPDTIDCASCHLATPVSRLIAQPRFALVEAEAAGAFHPDPSYVLPSEMAPMFDPAGPLLNIHAFSYVGHTPAINQRVVNETAAVVAYLNATP